MTSSARIDAPMIAANTGIVVVIISTRRKKTLGRRPAALGRAARSPVPPLVAEHHGISRRRLDRWQWAGAVAGFLVMGALSVTEVGGRYDPVVSALSLVGPFLLIACAIVSLRTSEDEIPRVLTRCRHPEPQS